MNAQGHSLPDALTLVFDGAGRATTVNDDSFPVWSPPDTGVGFAWQHLRLEAPATQSLLRASGLDEFVIDALMADETRPRCTVHGDGVILNLRGVNLLPDQLPEDMISVRMWLTEAKVIGVWRRPLDAVFDFLASIERGQGPRTPGDFVARMALRLADRAEPAITDLNERVDDLEEILLEPDADISRTELSAIRRSSIVLRGYLVPQRDALTTLEIEDLPWLQALDRSRLREASERIYRIGEDLAAVRERVQIIHDQLMDQRAERMNSRMLVLSVVSAVFLPLSLVAGVLGINVGGVPGASNPSAFWEVCVLLVVLGGVLLAVARWLGMFR
ncbi:zinc transporter ZntB [Ruegeria sp. AD91A]|uniref:zinc transporter ZntB n=1 Tax=Ruegeria sp. AD91A TaxID=2293862 RepID=UPI000E5468F5|nr:zinc transporter ZntB [Ruegeria sp. AD91A]AXT27278.1 zinc transporter ZntB [Ruegeria sp. AD91A]